MTQDLKTMKKDLIDQIYPDKYYIDITNLSTLTKGSYLIKAINKIKMGEIESFDNLYKCSYLFHQLYRLVTEIFK